MKAIRVDGDLKYEQGVRRTGPELKAHHNGNQWKADFPLPIIPKDEV